MKQRSRTTARFLAAAAVAGLPALPALAQDSEAAKLAQAGFYYNVERPDVAPRYQVRLQLQLLFPK